MTKENMIEVQSLLMRLGALLLPDHFEVPADYEPTSSENRKKKPKIPFSIDPELLDNLELPDKDISITEFCRAVNGMIDMEAMKRLTPVHMNTQLKKMGILGEKKDDSGRSETVTTEHSLEYGISSVSGMYNGREYEKIIYDEQGKRFLVDNLPDILEV